MGKKEQNIKLTNDKEGVRATRNKELAVGAHSRGIDSRGDSGIQIEMGIHGWICCSLSRVTFDGIFERRTDDEIGIQTSSDIRSF